MKRLKKQLIILLLLGVFSVINVNAQISCATPEHVDNRSADFKHVSTFNNIDTNQYCLKVNVHNVRTNGGGNGVNASIINAQMATLNSGFSGSGIKFTWDGQINNVNNSAFYNRTYTSSSGGCTTANLGQFNNDISSYVSNDAIDIFFRNRPESSFAGNIVGTAQILLNSGGINQPDVLAHELGHVLGLFHAYHGTIGNGGNNCENNDGSDEIAECVNGTTAQRAFSGDYVHDTVAENSDAYNVYIGPFGCTANVDLTQNDTCGDPFDLPNIDNFMSQSLYDCMDTFTEGQFRRMKYFLNESNPIPSLDVHKAKFICPVDPEPCDDCNGAAGQAQAVFNTLTNLNDDCVTYQLNFPLISLDCPDRFVITWNGATEQLNNNGDTITQVYAAEGIQTITIKVYRGNGKKEELCGTYDYTFMIDFDCGDPEPCDDCSAVADSIMATLGNGVTNICERKVITIPDLGTCYSGYVNWGDGTVDTFINNSVMSHQYTTPETLTIQVTLTEYNNSTNRLCRAEEDVTISCGNPCPDPCNIVADFSYTNSNCTYTFTGENSANNCDNSIYDFEWKVNGISYLGGENFTYNFSNEQGPNTVQLIVTYDNNGQLCTDSYTETVSVNCNSNPCPSDIGIYFNNEGGGGLCTTGQAGITGIGTINNIQNVNWTWALNGSTGAGAGNGTTSPIYYPSGNWTGYYIVICADITFTDGSTCQALCESFLMDCGDGRKDPNSLYLVPNPTKKSFKVVDKEGLDIAQIKVRNMYGQTIISKRSMLNQPIDMTAQVDGIYFVEILFTNGTIEVKKLILEK